MCRKQRKYHCFYTESGVKTEGGPSHSRVVQGLHYRKRALFLNSSVQNCSKPVRVRTGPEKRDTFSGFMHSRLAQVAKRRPFRHFFRTRMAKKGAFWPCSSSGCPAGRHRGQQLSDHRTTTRQCHWHRRGAAGRSAVFPPDLPRMADRQKTCSRCLRYESGATLMSVPDICSALFHFLLSSRHLPADITPAGGRARTPLRSGLRYPMCTFVPRYTSGVLGRLSALRSAFAHVFELFVQKHVASRRWVTARSRFPAAYMSADDPLDHPSLQSSRGSSISSRADWVAGPCRACWASRPLGGTRRSRLASASLPLLSVHAGRHTDLLIVHGGHTLPAFGRYAVPTCTASLVIAVGAHTHCSNVLPAGRT